MGQAKSLEHLATLCRDTNSEGYTVKLFQKKSFQLLALKSL